MFLGMAARMIGAIGVAIALVTTLVAGAAVDRAVNGRSGAERRGIRSSFLR